MATFQIENNEKKKLETTDDFWKWSEGCYHQACAFYKVAMNSISLLSGEEDMAVFTNIAFSCELYLKCLLFANQIVVKNEHNLFELFNKLPKEIRDQIKKSHPCGNISREEFITNLKEIGEAFPAFRYVYEKKEMAFNAQFLLELADLLHARITEKTISH